jgi:hypothetical protein
MNYRLPVLTELTQTGLPVVKSLNLSSKPMMQFERTIAQLRLELQKAQIDH